MGLGRGGSLNVVGGGGGGGGETEWKPYYNYLLYMDTTFKLIQTKFKLLISTHHYFQLTQMPNAHFTQIKPLRQKSTLCPATAPTVTGDTRSSTKNSAGVCFFSSTSPRRPEMRDYCKKESLRSSSFLSSLILQHHLSC